ncbi:DUF1826 domain-containing protein [Cognatiyoonia sp. IB215446]|uniref:DUF1826 domain-containing protein n=1 Tax=Cognatiyoonia sp. IB215446 TaxID=3097355 RepID=UPI002A120013|nr:DUF1826 domain-containing protein [Cognatiyoonia sp. IB215446]MDX8350218.1 DUF1826 domain-containing protein [Cognatiyoonia sp. IB215446]
MSFARAKVHPAAIGVAIADRPENLQDFLEPSCAAAIWRRQLSPDFQAWINGLDPTNLPQGRIILRPDAVGAAVNELCEIAQTPTGPERDQLVMDIDVLAEIFAALMQTHYIRLRLQPVTSNACRKFHIDAITARLVCTYRGTGTQYGLSPDGDDPSRVFTVPTGAPILLRGTLWPANPPAGLLHRSPPIEGTGETRLILVLDAVFDPEDD